jgi:hypothetical protein
MTITVSTPAAMKFKAAHLPYKPGMAWVFLRGQVTIFSVGLDFVHERGDK